MPIDYKKYPKGWQIISQKVKERFNYTCGICGVADKVYLIKSNGRYKMVGQDRIGEKGVFQIHLAAIHLDGDINNNDETNLLAACQKCHLDHDKEQHIRNRKYGSAHKGNHQIELFDK